MKNLWHEKENNSVPVLNVFSIRRQRNDIYFNSVLTHILVIICPLKYFPFFNCISSFTFYFRSCIWFRFPISWIFIIFEVSNKKALNHGPITIHNFSWTYSRKMTHQKVKIIKIYKAININYFCYYNVYLCPLSQHD